MSIWDTRELALRALDNNLREQRDFFSALYVTIDQCAQTCEQESEDEYFRVCGVTLVKAKYLSISLYSLILDGYGQECGACARPFIEYLELLTYFREDPERIQQVEENSLPTTGNRARLINSDYHGFRNHLNQNASHSAFSDYSTAHLFDAERRFKLVQPFSLLVLERNMRDLYVQTWLLASEAVNAIQTRRFGLADGQAAAIEYHRQQAKRVFDLDAIREGT